MPDLDDPKEFEAYSKHYTDLFIYQARQRLDSIRFFFIGFAVFANVIFSGQISNKWVVIVISLAAGIISIVFMRLDFRNAQIVEIDEKPLKDLQEFARSRVGGSNAWRTFERCDYERKRFTSYGELVSAIYVVAWVTTFGFAIYLLSAELQAEGIKAWQIIVAVFSVILFIFGYVATVVKPKVLDDFSLPQVKEWRRITFSSRDRRL